MKPFKQKHLYQTKSESCNNIYKIFENTIHPAFLGTFSNLFYTIETTINMCGLSILPYYVTMTI